MVCAAKVSRSASRSWPRTAGSEAGGAAGGAAGRRAGHLPHRRAARRRRPVLMQPVGVPLSTTSRPQRRKRMPPAQAATLPSALSIPSHPISTKAASPPIEAGAVLLEKDPRHPVPQSRGKSPDDKKKRLPRFARLAAYFAGDFIYNSPLTLLRGCHANQASWDLAPQLPWHVFQSPAQKWAVQPSFVIGEYLFITCALVAFDACPAARRAARHARPGLRPRSSPVTANDLIFMALLLVDNFAGAGDDHAYAAAAFVHSVRVHLLYVHRRSLGLAAANLPPLARAALSGLAASVFYAPTTSSAPSSCGGPGTTATCRSPTDSRRADRQQRCGSSHLPPRFRSC